MTTLYLIRHAEAEGNLYRRIHGQFDTNVTPNGRRQIAALARRFASIDIDACYSSDLTPDADHRPGHRPPQGAAAAAGAGLPGNQSGHLGGPALRLALRLRAGGNAPLQPRAAAVACGGRGAV